MPPNPPTVPPGTPPTSQIGTSPVPVIPTATDLPSALTSIAIIGQAIRALAQAQLNAQGGGQAAAASGGTFKVVQQNIETVTITDPNDSTVSVTVKQVTGLVLKNPTSGETWIWNLT